MTKSIIPNVGASSQGRKINFVFPLSVRESFQKRYLFKLIATQKTWASLTEILRGVFEELVTKGLLIVETYKEPQIGTLEGPPKFFRWRMEEWSDGLQHFITQDDERSRRWIAMLSTWEVMNQYYFQKLQLVKAYLDGVKDALMEPDYVFVNEGGHPPRKKKPSNEEEPERLLPPSSA